MVKPFHLVVAAIIVAAFAVAFLTLFQASPAIGSVIQSQEYRSTSTVDHVGVANLANFARLKGAGDNCTAGSLAQVTITGANTGVIFLWDATTTDSTLRAARFSSSSILVATFPASLAAGTYTFDAELDCGLIYELASGSVPTSTIMWR